MAKAEEQDTFNDVVEAIDALEVDPDRHLSIQIDKSIREGIRAAQTSGQTAEVVIKVKMRPGIERRMDFEANVSAKLPRPAVAAVTLYADAQGNLHKSDPAQLKIRFNEITKTDKE